MKMICASVVAALLGPMLMTACGADDPASELIGTWDGPGRATISLDSDGTGEGNDGCNDVGVQWEPAGDTTGTFSVTETGDMGCEGVEGWEEATTYVLSGDTLIIESGDGEDLTELTQAD